MTIERRIIDRFIARAVPTVLYAGFAVVLCFLSTGCGSTMLPDKDFVKTISAPADAESRVILCTDDFTADAEGKLLEKKYVVVRVGSNAAAHPRELAEYDNASGRVLGIEGRVIHSDGSHTRIAPGAFYRVNLSDGRIIAEQFARVASIPEQLAAGDLVEQVSLIEHPFPQFGTVFTPASLDHASSNVTCSIETAPGSDIQYQVLNAQVVPTVQATPAGGKKYVFAWPPYHSPLKAGSVTAEGNFWPVLLAAPAAQSWVTFGDWYLDLIKEKLAAGRTLADTTARIVAGKVTAKEKLDAIFDYCRRNVRYEQMYLANGEFIPNPADLVFQRRFGDCKDYAALMHVMAASAGVPTELVLCHRGRGWRMVESTPAAQFNHVILHFGEGGHDYWYDATDRTGISGTPSFDLANARALILERGKSRLATIGESADNLFRISGELAKAGEGGLQGVLTLAFARQFAVEFSWEQEHLNPEKMHSSLARTLKGALNDELLVDSLTWSASQGEFVITARCTIPNCLTTLGKSTYVMPSTLFPNLLPEELKDAELQKAFYFPYFNHVVVALTLSNAGAEPLPVTLEYRLPAGPFDDATRPGFLAQLAKAQADFTQSFIFKGSAHP